METGRAHTGAALGNPLLQAEGREIICSFTGKCMGEFVRAGSGRRCAGRWFWV